MADQKNETKLWNLLKKYLINIHFTRIESKTVNGIPDIFGVYNGISFWLELKADKVSYPKLSKWQISWINTYIEHGGVMLICDLALSQRALKFYRIKKFIEDPRKLVPDYVAPVRGSWPEIRKNFIKLISDN